MAQPMEAWRGISLESLEPSVCTLDLCTSGSFFSLNWFVILLLTQPIEAKC